MKKHPVETEFQQKYGNTGEPNFPTDCTDGSSKYGRKAMYNKPGRMTTCVSINNVPIQQVDNTKLLMMILFSQITYPTSTQKKQNESVLFVQRESSSQNRH